VRFELRRTVPLDGGLGFEVLADLGDDPRGAVHFGRFGMTYAEEIQESLAHLDLDMDELDEAFAPFAPPGFRSGASRGRTWRRTVLNLAQEEAICALHPFDRRRMAYLRSGEVNLIRINEVSPKLFLGLMGKSRDEVEQLFLRLERSLPSEEARRYVHASLNLQRHFANLTARTMPEALDSVQLDEAFMYEFCALQTDQVFGYGLPEGPQAYLRRYAFMHFDFEFVGSEGFGRIFEDFMNDFRRPRPRPKKSHPGTCAGSFGLSMDEIRRLSRRVCAGLPQEGHVHASGQRRRS
jgi:hypothetical protein